MTSTASSSSTASGSSDNKAESASRVALVTGANKGIGLAIAAGLAKAGVATVILGCRDGDRGKAAVEQLSKEHTATKFDLVQLDVTDAKQIDASVAYIKQTYGRLDILVNNAGIAVVKKPSDTTVSASFSADSEGKTHRSRICAASTRSTYSLSWR